MRTCDITRRVGFGLDHQSCGLSAGIYTTRSDKWAATASFDLEQVDEVDDDVEAASGVIADASSRNGNGQMRLVVPVPPTSTALRRWTIKPPPARSPISAWLAQRRECRQTGALDQIPTDHRQVAVGQGKSWTVWSTFAAAALTDLIVLL
jgi:hypothetical protein